MKNIFRIKKRFCKNDFNTLEEFYNYPSIAWQTNVRKKQGKIILESGLLNCNSEKSIFRFYQLTPSGSEMNSTEVLNYSCSMNSKKITTASMMQRTLQNNSIYLVFRSCDFGSELLIVTTTNSDFKVNKPFSGNEKYGYWFEIDRRYYKIDKVQFN